MPHLPRAASITQFASTAFIGAGGMLLLLASVQPGPKSTTNTVLQFVSAAALVALTHWSLGRQSKRGSAVTTFSSPLHAWGVVVCSTVAIGLALSAASGYLWEISHDSLPVNRANLLSLASSIIGISLCTSMLSWALSTRPAATPIPESPPHSQ